MTQRLSAPIRSTSEASRVASQSFEAYQPPLLLRNGHLQTVLASSFLRRAAVRPGLAALEDHDVQILTCGDGVRLEVLRSLPTGAPKRGRAICIHGWEGCAESNYMVATASQLLRSGYEVLRLHLRDHGATHHLNHDVFHSNRIAEVVDAVELLALEEPEQPPVIVGFSLGGNFGLRVALAAPRRNIPLAAVVAVNPLISPQKTMLRIDGRFSVYRDHFAEKWRRSLRKKQAAFPELYDFAAVEKIRSITAMTDYLVQRHTEYPTLEDYLDGYFLGEDRLAGLDVPALLITAANDPVVAIDDFRSLKASSAVQVEVHEHGGHCAFFSSLGLQSWIEHRIVAALDSIYSSTQ